MMQGIKSKGAGKLLLRKLNLFASLIWIFAREDKEMFE
jgi:hypothetical protein